MNRQTYGTLSHPGLRYNNPFSTAKIEEIIELLPLTAQSTVLEIGSGQGELLIRLVERYQVSALGLELDAASIEEARKQTATRILTGKLEFRECDARSFEADAPSFDLAVCLGACHIHGGFRPTLEHLACLVHPGGQLLIGDGYWKQEPAQEYLAALETTRDELQTHRENVETGVALDLLPLYAVVCSEDEWDRFEWLHMHGRCARRSPDDPELPAVIARIRAWRDIYLRWGRDTLGFGLYLFQK